MVEGRVTGFEGERGLGEVTAPDGTTYLFHCIAIADGTREIDVGAEVTFELLAKLGRYEARSIRPR